MIQSESEKLKDFIRLRSEYIDLLDQGHLSKIEFNEKNNKLFSQLNLRPFSRLDTFEKALFNYNYYNTKAKIALFNCNRFREQKRERRYKKELNYKLNCYDEKDKATLAMIKLEDPKNIEAYYINLHSKNLATSIFEICFLAKDKVILHSKSEQIRLLLEDLGVFKNELMDSLIDSYVNNG
ncbi:MAG: hypothetical protein Q4E50_00385 [Tissierellia bacterium]|nr:hypothetical protein [Tissierellia bacterium]